MNIRLCRGARKYNYKIVLYEVNIGRDQQDRNNMWYSTALF